MDKKIINRNKVFVVAVNMGYGHQRTAEPLRAFSFKKEIINANNYKGIPENDRKIWESGRTFYEFISRFKRTPLIGKFVFSFFDKLQSIPAYYPKRNMSKHNFVLKRIYSAIKKGWGKDFIERLKIKNEQVSRKRGQKLKINLPLVTTFFIPAFMAEFFKYPADIYCVICDADISRTWAPLNPRKSRIKYLAPNPWVINRLELYGVRKENIFLSGYPLPKENIGSEKMEILKKDLGERILNLDPAQKYRRRYKLLIEKKVGQLPKESGHSLTIMFSIGGAGAQKKIAINYVKSLSEKIKQNKIKIILSAGIRKEVERYFLKEIKKLKLEKFLGRGIEIIFKKEIRDYFSLFNQKLRKTDILWTKPSELSFYSALGVPIIIAPPIGSQEDFNKKWLLHTGAGILGENPKYANEWIFDSLNSGRFAEAAMQGFIEEEKLGTFNIQQIISP